VATAYQYRAWDRSGKLVTGTVQADHPSRASERLRAEGFFLSSLKPVREKKPLFRRTKSLSAKPLSLFCQQFSIMINTGMPIVSCLQALNAQMPDKSSKKALESVCQQVAEGGGLGESLGRHPKTFPRLFIDMIELGEVSGNLPEILDRLAIYYERDAKLRGDVKQAMTYPAVVSSFAVLSVVVVLFTVIPKFAELFADFNGKLPLITRIVLSVQATIAHGYLYVISAIVLLYFALRRFGRTKRGRWVLDSMYLRLPIAGDLIVKVLLSRFCQTLSLLLSGGVTVMTALEFTRKVAGNVVLAADIAMAQTGVARGQGISEPLRHARVFPKLLVNIIAIGEETGSTEKVLTQVSEFYDKEVDRTVKGLTSVIEPILIAALSGVIGTIAAAVFMPMFDVVNVMGG
jgi:type IV pilus assembly protein PilC